MEKIINLIVEDWKKGKISNQDAKDMITSKLACSSLSFGAIMVLLLELPKEIFGM